MGTSAQTGNRTIPQSKTKEKLPQDEVYFLLKNGRRRAVIQYLLEQEAEAEFDDLVIAIATREKNKPVSQISYKERKSVHTSLYQSHLPKLQEAGVVEYDKRRGSVRLTDTIDTIRPYLDLGETRKQARSAAVNRSWKGAYGALVASIGLVAGAHWLSIYRFEPLGLSVVLLTFSMVFAAAPAFWHRN